MQGILLMSRFTGAESSRVRDLTVSTGLIFGVSLILLSALQPFDFSVESWRSDGAKAVHGIDTLERTETRILVSQSSTRTNLSYGKPKAWD